MAYQESKAELLRVEGLTKAFSGVEVLKNLTVSLHAGEILGVIGENGAGKSTFMKLISGVYSPTRGEIIVDGIPTEIPNTITAQHLGISMIPQEFNLINTLRVYENIFLGRELRRNGMLDRRSMIATSRTLFEQLDTDVDPEAMVGNLSVAKKQMVEIAKAMSQKSRLLIMDEPTTVLSGAEIDSLFTIMRDFTASGGAIMFVSHKLGEVTEICDTVMVLRDGDLISVDPVEALDEHEMARRMVGRELSETFPPKAVVTGDATALSVQNLSVDNTLYGISFDLRKGEILGIAGLMGAGRTELGETLMGLRHMDSGTIYAHGEPVEIHNPRDAMQAGIAYLSEDRQGRGLLLIYDTVVNITLASLREYSKFFIQNKRCTERAQYYVDSFNIRIPSLTDDLAHLSGGNQQKVYLSKWLDTSPTILILDEPTRGIDVGARREIYGFIHDLIESGLSCIIISSELEELLGMCNRILVMREGRLVGTLADEHMSDEEIMFYATGLKEHAI
jgi:ribose transport system ATP-binding protein